MLVHSLIDDRMSPYYTPVGSVGEVVRMLKFESYFRLQNLYHLAKSIICPEKN